MKPRKEVLAKSTYGRIQFNRKQVRVILFVFFNAENYIFYFCMSNTTYLYVQYYIFLNAENFLEAENYVF